jgi:hypothetical protein
MKGTSLVIASYVSMGGANVHVPLDHDKTLPLTHATVPLTEARECYNEPLGGAQNTCHWRN